MTVAQMPIEPVQPREGLPIAVLCRLLQVLGHAHRSCAAFSASVLGHHFNSQVPPGCHARVMHAVLLASLDARLHSREI